MKLFLDPNQLPSQDQFDHWYSTLQMLKSTLQSATVSLSMDERKTRRKMGPRHLAYAQSAERRGVQHEEVMPRTFHAMHFTAVIHIHHETSKMLALVEEIHEMLDDTLMAVGIDAMTYTKMVHDGLRAANQINPSLDGALRELDEFNKKAQAESAEEEDIALE